MAEDILARFETPGRNPEGQDGNPAEGGKPEYIAFDTQDKLVTLDIERAAAPCRCPRLQYYLDISYSPRFYSGFTLFFTYMSVRVHGKNLKPVVDAFRFTKCTAIREYHAELFAAPPPEGAPLIEKIEIVVRPLHEALIESEEQTEQK
jgi:hypothetical protein